MTNNSIKLIIIILLAGCKKSDDSCKYYSGIEAGFNSYEYVLDTVLQTDTSFVDKDIFFKTNETYSTVLWNIGADPRTFNTQSVNLRFSVPENLDVTLKGTSVDQYCNPQNFAQTKPFVVLENNGLVKSPLIGSYKGYNIGNPNDTFTVIIKFWIGARYNWWNNGAYSVENLPKGYIDTTQNFNGYSRPEIKGIIASTGYKNIAIDKHDNFYASGIKGYGGLKRGAIDTLLFNYKIIDTLKFNQTGQISYLQKTFIGLKN